MPAGCLFTSCTLVLLVLELLAAARPSAVLASIQSGGPDTYAPVAGEYVSRSTYVVVSKFAAVAESSSHERRALWRPRRLPASSSSKTPSVQSRLPSPPVSKTLWLATGPNALIACSPVVCACDVAARFTSARLGVFELPS